MKADGIFDKTQVKKMIRKDDDAVYGASVCWNSEVFRDGSQRVLISDGLCRGRHTGNIIAIFGWTANAQYSLKNEIF